MNDRININEEIKIQNELLKNESLRLKNKLLKNKLLENESIKADRKSIKTENESLNKEVFLVYQSKKKSETVAFLLSFFLGGLAIDRFYLNQPIYAIAKLFLVLSFSILYWPSLLFCLIDLFLIIPATRNYNSLLLHSLKNQAKNQ